MKKIISLAFICLIAVYCQGQESWQLKKDREGIKVYTREVEGSRIKQIKVSCSIDATLSQLTALIMDAPAHERWVYNTKRSYVIHQVDEHHQLYYSETSLPWPLSNRDVVVDMVISQDPVTKVLEVSGHSVDGTMPEKKGLVRVPMSQVSWKVTPKGDHTVQVDYTAQADPGGSIPAWLINAFITKGPFETFVKFRELVKEDTYRRAQYAFIEN